MTPPIADEEAGDAFRPPQSVAPRDGANLGAVTVLWMLSWATVGAGIGAMMHRFGITGFVPPLALGLGTIGGMAGLIGYRTERAAARSRQGLVDGRGRLVHPMAPWVMGIPMFLVAAGLFCLVYVGTADRGWAPAAALGLVALAMALVLRPFWSSQSLSSAVALMEHGDNAGARRGFERLANALWVTGGARRLARLNLGLMSLREGALDDASRWYGAAGAGEGNALASTGLALVRVLEDRYEDAEKLLQDAGTSPDGRHAQTEIDAVALLLTLRKHGPAECVRQAERAWLPGQGSLFLAVLAAARARLGDADGARALLEEPAVQAALEHGFGDVVAELRELRWEL